MSALLANNVRVYGDPDATPMIFAHGFGCEQGMWRFVAPAFEASHRVVLYDHMGVGGSDVSQYDPDRYATLDGYADDLLQICDELELSSAVFVGHSVGAMIGVLASIVRPELFESLVLIAPSPRYVDDGGTGYVGGFTSADIDDLLATLDRNYLGWVDAMAPVIVGGSNSAAQAGELAEAMCRADPAIAHEFAKATFLADNRADLGHVAPRCLVMQCSDDAIAPEGVGRYVADQIPQATYRKLSATGHCPNLSAPEETIQAIQEFL